VTRAGLAAVAAGACLIVPLALPAGAFAHPRLVGATPASDSVVAGAPSTVTLRFDERADPVGAGLEVRAPSGRQVGTGPVRRAGRTLSRAVRAAEPGTYVVEWLAVGRDTHPARGAVLFSVGERTQARGAGSSALGEALQAVGRWLSFAGFALGFGLPFASAAMAQAMTRPLWRLVGLGVAAMVVAEAVSLLGQTATLQPSDPFQTRLAGDILLTSYGRVAGLRLGGALALWALAGAVRQSSSPRALWAIPALGAAIAVVHADAAHRITGIPTAVSLLVVAVHVAAAAAWLGLVLLAILGRPPSARRLVVWAAGATSVLVLTGVALAVGHLHALGDLVATGYGEALSAKLAVVALALLLGGLGFRRGELAVAAAALAAATTLVSLLPPV
jgi:copper transport protein